MMTVLPWTEAAALPLLAPLQLLPLGSALLLLLLPPRQQRLSYSLATLLALAELGLASELYRRFDPSGAPFQFAEQWSLFAPISYHAAVDGVALLFILLTVFLGLMAVLYGWVRNFTPPSHFLALLFGCESAVVSQFASLDLLWFLLCSMVQFVLASWMIHRWSSSLDEGMALRRFAQFMGIGVLLLLIALLLLGWNQTDRFAGRGSWHFDWVTLMATPVPITLQPVLFFLLFYGMALRIPLFPLHGWLPLIAEHGTVVPAMVFLLGVKTGIYGLLRFVLPLLPQEAQRWQLFVVVSAVVGVFYAALLALKQHNLRRMMAYAIVSHTGIITIGLFSLQLQSFQGAILLSAHFGLATAGLFFVIGLVNLRTHTVLLDRLGSLFDHLPLLGLAFFVAGLAIVAMPGTPGFNAVHLMLEAAIHRFGALPTIAAALGNVASAACLLWAFQRIFLSPPRITSATSQTITRLHTVEIVFALTLIFVQLIAGFFPEPWLRLVDNSARLLSEYYISY
ncbi:MAG: NADH-quinone oxidoreductase subunit M [Magnetococcales bacterium]|nr:NADH-quinone oxidoreductase subunit M [Magnetococcales bacterium]